MKNIFLLLSFIATLFVSGCGGGSSTPADTTAPTTTAAPAVSGTTDTATTLSVTINENGTGYYLVQAAASAVPAVSTTQAGTSFAMTANVAATPAISGLTASTAYTIYFVAKDAANNVQATVQSVNVTTAPTITAAPAVSGTTDTATTLSVTINENGTGYYLVQAAASAVPAVSAVQATGTSFAMTANVAATQTISGLTFNTPYTIYFVAKDTANNVLTTVRSVAVTTLLTAGYVVEGGLTWMPVTAPGTWTWTNANAYCANTTINGVTGWRQPTQTELYALYAAYPNNSSVLTGQGWTLGYAWSSTSCGAGTHDSVNLSNGGGSCGLDTSPTGYVSCVR